MQDRLFAFRAPVPAVEVSEGADTGLNPAEAQKCGGGKPVAAEMGGLGPEQQPAADPADGQCSFNPHNMVGMTRMPDDFHRRMTFIEVLLARLMRHCREEVKRHTKSPVPF